MVEDDQVQLSLLVEETVSPFDREEGWAKGGRELVEAFSPFSYIASDAYLDLSVQQIGWLDSASAASKEEYSERQAVSFSPTQFDASSFRLFPPSSR